MTQRVLGPTGSRRRRRILPGLLLLAAVFALFLTSGAQAVHDIGLFELDKNAINDVNKDGVSTPTPGDDWDTIYNLVKANPSAGNACSSLPNEVACAWMNDPLGATIFTGGSSKDDIDINVGSSVEWMYKTGSVPPKDEISDGYAAMYNNPTDTHQILYVGADRFANNGSSDFGAWFFQSSVSLNANGTFSGQHVPGDVLLLGTFTQGGAVTSIRVFKWVGTGGTCPTGIPFATSNGTVCGPIGTFSDCVPGSTGDQGCGTVNGNFVAAKPQQNASPWPYTPKFPDSGQPSSGSFPGGSFFEGGLDLTSLNLAGCFSSFLIETRSSPSVDATLKDFVLGNFEVCKPTLVTTPSATVTNPVTPGTSVTDTAVITGTGTANPPNPTSPPNVTFSICGPIATGVCDSSDAAHTPTQVGATKPLFHCTGVGTPNPTCTGADPQGRSRAISDAVNTSSSKLSPGRYCFTASWTGDTNYPAGASDVGAGNSECFAVKDTSSVLTDQNWLPNDSATVKNSSGGAASGTVTFTLYDNGTCNGNVIHTFGPTTLNASGQASTSNTTFGIAIEPGTTISWSVTYTPSDPNAISGSTSNCESSVVTIDDND